MPIASFFIAKTLSQHKLFYMKDYYIKLLKENKGVTSKSIVKIITKKNVLALFFVLYSIAAFSQTTIYVNSSTGNDTSGDGTSLTPYKTFTKGYTSASSGDTIDLTGTFTWTDADETGDAAGSGYTLSKNLTIRGQGPGSTIIQAHSSENSADRKVLSIGSSQTVVIKNLTIRHGNLSGSVRGAGVSMGYAGNLTMTNCIIEKNYISTTSTRYYGGGGISVYGLTTGNLTLDKCQIQNNYSTGTGGGGGGIHISMSSTNSGEVNITNSTFSNNTANAGTAIYGRSPRVKITNTTISGNTGGTTVYLSYGSTSYKEYAFLTNVTIAYNSLGTSGTGLSGNLSGVSYSPNGVILKNTIIAQNKRTDNTQSDYSGSATNNGYNLVEVQSGSTFANGVNGCIVGAQSNLNLSSTLADNGTLNSTQTLALSAGSVAINAGNNTANGIVSVPSEDQKGYPRKGTTDIGPFEFISDEILSFTEKTGYHQLPDDIMHSLFFSIPPDIPSYDLRELGVNIDATSGAGDVKMAIYDSSNNLLYQTAEFSVTGGVKEYVFASIPSENVTLVAGNSYYVSIIGNPTTGTNIAIEASESFTNLGVATNVSTTSLSISAGNTYPVFPEPRTNNISWYRAVSLVVRGDTLDSTPPTITFNPINGATGVTANSNITITFDEAVRNTDDSVITDTNVDGLITLKDTNSSGTNISFDATIDGDKKIITINPSSDFSSEQVIYVAIGSTVEDSSDNAITAANATFTSADINSPAITFSPVNSATEVAANSNITITFDEAVRNTDDSVITDTNIDGLITLKETNSSGANINFDATIDGDKKIITINPSSDFSSEQVVYVAIGTTVEDSSNNAITAANSSFTSAYIAPKLNYNKDNYDIAKASFKGITLDISAQELASRDMLFNNDGSILYVIGIGGNDINQYSLSTLYDISTASFNSVALDVAAQVQLSTDMLFNNDGSVLYVMGTWGDNINQYNLTTNYDIASATFNSIALSVATEELTPNSMLFNNDGSILYVLGASGEDINQYNLSTPYDISTATFNSIAISVAAQEPFPTEMIFNNDGSVLYVMGFAKNINQYNLSTPYDISTAIFNSIALSVSGQETIPYSMLLTMMGLFYM